MTDEPPPIEPVRPPTPRWVKAFGIAAIAVVLVLAAALLLGGGHGPARHSLVPHGAVPVAEQRLQYASGLA